MKFALAFFTVLSMASSAFAGAAFSENTSCTAMSQNGVGGSTLKIAVINSQTDGYSHQIELDNGEGPFSIASLEDNNSSNMDKYYGKFQVNVAGKKGVLTFDGDSYVHSEKYGQDTLSVLRKATLSLGGEDKIFLCVVSDY